MKVRINMAAGGCDPLLPQVMQTLYQECNLVHADLSEYNILWFEAKVGNTWDSSHHAPTRADVVQLRPRPPGGANPLR